MNCGTATLGGFDGEELSPQDVSSTAPEAISASVAMRKFLKDVSDRFSESKYPEL